MAINYCLKPFFVRLFVCLISNSLNVIEPGKPVHLTCNTSAFAKSLKIKWLEPSDPNGIIRGYNIFWRKLKNINAIQTENNGTYFNSTTVNKSVSIENLGE